MINIFPIPAFDDNYIWIIHDDKYAVVVDPGDSDPVHEYLAANGLQLAAILITHHHHDHVGGIADLIKGKSIPVFGPHSEHIAGISHPVKGGDTITLDQVGLKLSVIDTPGHTSGHIAYYGANHLFCGDTLFACGCGRLFEGTPEQMYASLSKLAQLPPETLIYCAHEYTLANIRFALAVEPDNPELLNREKTDIETRRKNLPTLPSNIGLELLTNPFLRTNQKTVMGSASKHAGIAITDPVLAFSEIRRWKNNFA